MLPPPCMCHPLLSLQCSGLNKQQQQRLRPASSSRRSSPWSRPLWKRWWMLYGRCGASGPPFMTTSTPMPWSSASTPWRTSSPSTSVRSGCSPRAYWHSSATSSSRSSKGVRRRRRRCGLGPTWRVRGTEWQHSTNSVYVIKQTISRQREIFVDKLDRLTWAGEGIHHKIWGTLSSLSSDKPIKVFIF